VEVIVKLNGLVTKLSVILVVAVLAVALVPASASAEGRGPVARCETSIVDLALSVNAETGEFSTLIAALQATNLVRWFDCPPSGRGKTFTVFAPTDAAFEKLGLNAQNIGSALPKYQLRTILFYHVTLGALLSSDVAAQSSLKMLNKGTVGVEINDQGAFLLSNNDPSQIIAFDFTADNGVIHVIDTVLLP
jgi:uncharacterized surface protein with fasciclin (FAS1) repeats